MIIEFQKKTNYHFPNIGRIVPILSKIKEVRVNFLIKNSLIAFNVFASGLIWSLFSLFVFLISGWASSLQDGLVTFSPSTSSQQKFFFSEGHVNIQMDSDSWRGQTIFNSSQLSGNVMSCWIFFFFFFFFALRNTVTILRLMKIGEPLPHTNIPLFSLRSKMSPVYSEYKSTENYVTLKQRR